MAKKRIVKKSKSHHTKMGSHHEHQFFWFFIALVVVLPIVGFLNYNSESNLSGNAIMTIAYMQEGTELFFEVDEAGVQYATVYFVEGIKNSKITTEELEVLGWEFDGVKYSQFHMTSVDEEKIGDIVFDLKLEESKMLELGLKTSTLKLFLNGEPLETEFQKKEGNYIYFTAISQDMGEFVIGKAEQKAIVGEVIKKPIVEEVVEEPVEPEVQEPAPLPVVEEVGEDDEGFFVWLRELFS
ncbi:hypothetical protein HOE37_05450 [Candidatus Woesearchaeota archaeon]|jgi:hypothetical protein|nr:hypothetical protein [Candidatus Woesearchaeota archaeon]MBT4111278.1 hypothetical protein [Candidatus Woesearchaeota archaeon]MBT4335811.1 hypothetical protein [Candidatus Woesearchaeota archaeon]MBT4469211.1 hypothetical protein [Candidatus Woesearchaeota archaeon]MBT6744376.1 hypothetical protein [Candidatus Woesearchaeota archaeon]